MIPLDDHTNSDINGKETEQFGMNPHHPMIFNINDSNRNDHTHLAC